MKNFPIILSVLVCLMLVPVAGFSQAANGTITGTITDASGAVIPGVTIEVKNTETGVVFTTISTETGNYTAPNLPPGSYSISAALPGFKNYARTGVNLAAAQTVKIDIPLEVGTAGETISVSADAKKETLTDFLKSTEMPWDHWWNGQTGGIVKDWNVKFFPTIYVLDSEGVIRYKHIRGKELEDAVEKLLAEAKEKK